MKNTLMTLTALVATGVLAQPSIDQTGVGYVVGDSYTVATGTWDENAGPSGADVTWDFSGLDNSNTTALNVLDPAGTPSGASYPSSNVAVQVDASTEYFSQNGTIFERVGNGFDVLGTPLDIVYNDPETYWAYPMGLGDFFVDSYSGEAIIDVPQVGQGTFSVSGSGAGAYDGYGRLILPEGELTDVVRIKVIKSYSQSIDFTLFQQDIGTNNDTIYYFFKPGYKLPVLTLTKSAGDFLTTSTYQYLYDPALYTEQEELANISVYPNPSTGTFNIAGLEKLVGGTGQIVDVTGKVVDTFEIGASTVNRSVSLPAGIYTIRMEYGELKATRRLVIAE